MKVLVVADEPKVADALREGLLAEQYGVAIERTGDGAFYRTAAETSDDCAARSTSTGYRRSFTPFAVWATPFAKAKTDAGQRRTPM